MNRQILALSAALACGSATACDCEPGSLTFQDAFFKNCEPARARYEILIDLTADDAAQEPPAPGADGTTQEAAERSGEGRAVP